jgi:predicted O-linked N-acetylglucosamine transferase (SPINDLY family)
MTAVAETLALALHHHQTGDLERAEQLYREILNVNPQHVDAWHLLGLVAGLTGRHKLAIDHLRQAVRLNPNFAEAHYNLGTALREQGSLDEAIASYRLALRLKPALIEARNNLGNTLRLQGKLAEAAAVFEEALKLKPDHADVHYNLGNTRLDQGKPTGAALCYQQALRLQPDHADALVNLGLAWRDLGQLDEAALCMERALRLNPAFGMAHNNLGNVLKDKGELDRALACYRRALDLKADAVGAHSNILYVLHFCPGYDSAALCAEHRDWHERHAAPLPRLAGGAERDGSAERRLRIGYVSPDFRDHVVGRNVLPLMRQHDKSQFEITLYATLIRAADARTKQFQKHADNWRDVTGWPNERVADQIAQDGVDILVDLALHLAGNRLPVFARKPAPVQVTFAGYPGSTGVRAIDYRLTDPYLDPPGMFDALYAEESYRLTSFWCYDPLTTEPPVNELPALKNGYVTFGCLNNFCKVNDPTLELWAKVLRTCQRSRLILLAAEGTHRQRTLDVLAHEQVAADRVTFVSPRPRPAYLKLYHQIDVGLDTLPYNGHTTSLDSFWMGVPVVTMTGQTVVGRAGVSQLSNLGLRELIAANPEEFASIVTALAGDLPRLRTLRAGLRQRMQDSPLMDAARFTRDIEAAYRDMWRRWCGTRV